MCRLFMPIVLFSNFLIMPVYADNNMISVKCKYELLEIYYIDWNILTRQRLGVDDVKQNYDVYIKVKNNNKINSIFAILNAYEFKMNDMRNGKYIEADARLVLEFKCQSSKSLIYYSDGEKILTDNSKYISTLDPLLISKFDFISKENQSLGSESEVSPQNSDQKQ